VTWSFGPGEVGEILGALMFGPGGGAATMAIVGSNRSSDKTNATFFVNGDMAFLCALVGKPKQTFLVTHRHEQPEF
jgi:hypothetical protein